MQLESVSFGMITLAGWGIIAIALAAVLVLAAICAKLHFSVRRLAADWEELAAANKDIEASIKTKGEFLVSMSHEIRNPMNALTSFTEILLQRIAQNCSAELLEETEGIIDIIKKSSHDLLTIINDLLDYIRIDANLLIIESVPMSIKQVIHDVCHVEKPHVIAKRLELFTKYSNDVPQTILCDPVRIRQILSNLINNAIKFTEKGTITVMCEVLDTGESSSVTTSSVPTKDGAALPQTFSATSKLLKISVTDTGIGISPTYIQELYKPFRRADSTSLQKKRGTGLGLNIAMRLATLMDGTITVESTLGQGSTFSLLLNVYVPEGAEPIVLKKGDPETNQGSKLHDGLDIRLPAKKSGMPLDSKRPIRNVRVLVMEDMVVNQVIMATLLRDAGAQVELADNGAIGVQKVLKDMDNGLFFDVILMDMQMPVMDGFEATEYLRKHGYSRPIIAVTAHGLTGDREKTLSAGCDDYIAKPIDNQTLIDMVKKHVGGN